MKAGYSLLELTIGIFLAALLAISLFQSVRSTTTTVELADDLMDFDMRVATFHHQFQNDTIGIFVPSFAAKASKDVATPTAKPGNQQAAPAAKPAQPAQLVTEQKPEKSPDKLFYSDTHEGHASELTFITTNPMRVYEKAANVTVKPRMVRVMYRLLLDEGYDNSFTLYRQEVDDLDISAVDKKGEKSVRSYALLKKIKKMSFEFSYPIKKETPKEQVPVELGKSPAAPKKPSSNEQTRIEVEKIVTRADWPFKTAEEAQEKNVPPYPQLITAKFALWDNVRQSERELTLSYPIASFTLFEKKKKKTQQPTKQAPQPQPAPGSVNTRASVKRERIDVRVMLNPTTEERLAQLGEQVISQLAKIGKNPT